MERMRDELSRARRRGDRVLMPEAVASPMDLNPTLEVSAALIADCADDISRTRAMDVIDAEMRSAASGVDPKRPRRNTA